MRDSPAPSRGLRKSAAKQLGRLDKHLWDSNRATVLSERAGRLSQWIYSSLSRPSRITNSERSPRLTWAAGVGGAAAAVCRRRPPRGAEEADSTPGAERACPL